MYLQNSQERIISSRATNLNFSELYGLGQTFFLISLLLYWYVEGHMTLDDFSLTFLSKDTLLTYIAQYNIYTKIYAQFYGL